MLKITCFSSTSGFNQYFRFGYHTKSIRFSRNHKIESKFLEIGSKSFLFRLFPVSVFNQNSSISFLKLSRNYFSGKKTSNKRKVIFKKLFRFEKKFPILKKYTVLLNCSLKNRVSKFLNSDFSFKHKIKFKMVIFFAFVMVQIWINRFKDDAVSESSSSVDLMISECYNAVSAG